MLLELQGLASVQNVQVVTPTFVKLQLVFSDTNRQGGNEYKTYGSRWVSLTKEDSVNILKDYGEEGIKQCLVNVSASAITDQNNDKYYDNYRVSSLQVLGGRDASQGVENKEMFLRGTGTIRSIKRISDSLTKICVVTSESRGDDEVRCTRWITTRGKSAKYFAELGDELINHKLQFKAKVSTEKKSNENEETRYFENYTAVKNAVVWTTEKAA